MKSGTSIINKFTFVLHRVTVFYMVYQANSMRPSHQKNETKQNGSKTSSNHVSPQRMKASQT